jgi:hypothetical protein
MFAMWHCNVKASSLSDWPARLDLPLNACKERKNRPPEGARSVQTIYMTGRMQIDQKARLTAILQALILRALD